MSGGLLLGRTKATLDRHQDASNALFAADRADNWDFNQRTYSHCTFANISFKDATFNDCKFVNCAFLDCYFRRTSVTNSMFTGCKFEDCTFTDVSFVAPKFLFPLFRGCFIPYKEIGAQLPDDPGLRYKMADELAREAATSGAQKDARAYRLVAADAHAGHLRNIALAVGSDYYRHHFEVKDRVNAGGSYVWRKVNRALWGYGERGWVLGRSFVFVGALVFPLAFWLFCAESLKLSDGLPLRFVDYELFSFDNLLNRTGFSDIAFTGTGAKTLVGVEVLIGLVFIGLFISLVFNWMRRR